MTNQEIINCYIGEDPVEKLYMGTELVWPLGPTPTPPYEEQYFTVEMVSAGTFNISQNRTTGLYYSLNGGAWTAASTSMNLSAGDKVRFKGDLEDINPTSMFSGNTTPFMVYGNIMSLGYPDNFSTSSPITETGYFMGLFKGSTGLADALNLVMPTGVTNSCYDGMFSGCTSLEYAPCLPAETLANYCYQNMFAGCTSLKYIKCLATNMSATNCTYNWVSGITTDGVFVQASGATGWEQGVNIPETWIPIDAPQHDEGMWLRYYDAGLENPDYYETSGSTSGDIYVFAIYEIGGSGFIDDMHLFQDGNYVFLDEVDICGYNCSDSECSEICGGEGGEDPNTGQYIECNIMTGDTRYISPAYQIRDITYTPSSNTLSIQTHAEDCGGEVDCANDWESLGYESEADCNCQNYGIDCPEGTDCSDWENLGYESYEDCDCQENGNCGDDPGEVDCSDWENLGYESEDDCSCQNFGYDTNGDPCGEPEEEGGEEEPEE